MNSDARQLLVDLAIAVCVIAVFTADLLLRLGVAVWVLYLLPVALCTRQRRPAMPLALAALCALLIVVGFFASAEGMLREMAALNRTFGVFTLMGVAILVRQVILAQVALERIAWRNEGLARVGATLLGEQRTDEVGRHLLESFANYVHAHVGVVYLLEGERLARCAGFALDPDRAPAELAKGQGIVGQVAADGVARTLADPTDNALPVSSALGHALPRHMVVAPLLADNAVIGVMEVGFAGPVDDLPRVFDLSRMVAEVGGIAFRSALYRQRLVELLEETQRQSEELQTQQEELRVSNEELEEQGRALRESQAQLEGQQADLEQTNVQLEEQTHMLERQKRDLLLAQSSLQQGTAELERTNRYKSEFLANMSHELRTPLNSALILSKLLGDNNAGNLTEEQIGWARVIHSANNDLLTLINDVLDLSKIEAGHVELTLEPVVLAPLIDALRESFAPIAEQKGVALHLEIAGDVPPSITTDAQRLQQILRNLLSNAFKFTERGEVRLGVTLAASERVAIAVRDTGIGIAPEQQEVIFEAFRQADGTTSRSYGGTGLGLSISRTFAALLGGALTVESNTGMGSTFLLDLPLSASEPAEVSAPSVPVAAPPPTALPNHTRTAAGKSPLASQPAGVGESTRFITPPHIDDDRARSPRPDRLVLVVEDDAQFARILYGIAHDLGFDCVHATTAKDALDLARELQPSGILLDVGLPDLSGLALLERLKRDAATRHIPVHVVSVDDHRSAAMELGAVGYLVKPVDRDALAAAIGKLERAVQQRVRRVLVVEDDAELRANIALLLRADDIEIVGVGTVAAALEELRKPYDCLIMDLTLPDGSGYDLLERMAASHEAPIPPVIVYTGRALTRAEEQRLRRYSRSIIIKGARSPARLLDEVTLFLHRVESALPPDHQQLLKQARQRDKALDGRRVLLAEDDARNIFALSHVLEPLGINLVIARNGREAVDALQRERDIDLVLMDIMMPEMDGLTAIRAIRADADLAEVPIIALTAKAMQDDRRRCLEAGANDYIAKPIDVDKLVSLCRVWMRK